MTLHTDAADTPDLYIRQMRIVWRDTFIVAHNEQNEHADFLTRACERLRRLPCYLSDTRAEPPGNWPEELRVADRVSQNVARNGHPDLLRFQLADLQMANLRPTLARWHRPPAQLSAAQIRTAAVDADSLRSWIGVTPQVVLHRAGVGIVEYTAAIYAPGAHPEDDRMPAVPGFTPDEAIELVRLGIQTQLLSLPDAWRNMIPEAAAEWRFFSVVGLGPDKHLALGGLRDLSQIISAHLNAPDPHGVRRRRQAPTAVDIRPARPTGSTTVVLVETEPQAGSLGEFVAQYAAPLRGVGAMDTYFRERALAVVERELSDNLSTDSETAVYLLGNSELIVFNDELPPIITQTRGRLGLRTEAATVYYLYMHYAVLLEWVYLQDALLRAYLQRLDVLVASSPLRRREMIGALHGALADLIQYQEDITPFATRIEFLEKTRAHHKLDQLGERFERKQDLLLNYSSEYHDFREARAAEFLNWLAAILAGGELGNLAVTAFGITPDRRPLYLGITLGCIGLAIVVMTVLRVFNRR